MLNTTFNGYDDTIKAESVQAIQMAIDSVEMQAAAITGVFPEKLGGIQQRDAVSNVKVGIKYSTLLTKQYFSAMDLMYKEVNYDLLNLAKLAFKKGITGTIVLGNKYNQIFTALPKHYTLTDFDIHIQDSTESFQDKENIKALTTELIKANYADPEVIFNLILAKNITELRQYLNESLKSKKAENNQLQQYEEQLQQYEQQLQQLDKQLKDSSKLNEQLQKQLEKSNEITIELDKKRIALEEQELRDKKEYNNKLIETKEKQLQIEILHLNDNNPYNDKIKNVI